MIKELLNSTELKEKQDQLKADNPASRYKGGISPKCVRIFAGDKDALVRLAKQNNKTFADYVSELVDEKIKGTALEGETKIARHRELDNEYKKRINKGK